MTPRHLPWRHFIQLSVAAAATEDDEKRDDDEPYALVVEYVAKTVIHSNLHDTLKNVYASGVCAPPIGEPRSLLLYYVEAKILLP